MKNSSEVDFVAMKLDLFCEAISHEPTRANIRLLFGGPLTAWQKDGAPTRARLVKLESTLELMAAGHLDPSARPVINRMLKQAFGYAALDENPLVIVNRVLRQKKIATQTEAEIIRPFINDQGNESVIGAQNFRRLAQFMAEYGD